MKRISEMQKKKCLSRHKTLSLHHQDSLLKRVSHDPIFQMKSQQSSGFKLRSPDSKFSAPSGFQHEDLNYKVWDHLGLLVRMRSLLSRRTSEISRTSGQTSTQNPKDAAAINTKHIYQVYIMCRVLCAHISLIFTKTLQEEH